MNETITDFLQKNNINIDTIQDLNFKVKSSGEINPILERYYIPGKEIKKDISIAHILGYSYEERYLQNNLIENLSEFFDPEGETYQTRSLGMLTMDRDTCVETLKNVSIHDTVYVRECEQNKYVISENGMHRYHVLRFHYLNELSQIDKNDKERIKALQDKYTIPVKVQKTDYIKTYSYFILRKLMPGIQLRAEYNDLHDEKTGNVVVIHQDKRKVFTDEQLLEFLQNVIANNTEKIDEYVADSFEYHKNLLPTFKTFLEENNIDIFSQEASL